MHKFVRSLITEWRKLDLPFGDATIVVAVSGGADSTSLLAAIHDLVNRKKLKDVRIIAAHFNHGLRGEESDADEAFVSDRAIEYGFEFVAKTGKVARRGNLEQNARDARYKFLSGIATANSSSIVLTGHTKNDQAETFLLNLIRGSGRDGLTGMRRVRELDDSVLLVRPLVSWAVRADTTAYCRDNKIDFRTDPMNEDEAFTRVRIRKTVLPLLAEINPKIVNTLANTAELLLDRPASETGTAASSGASAALLLKDLKDLPRPKLYSEIRSWLGAKRGGLRSIQLKHIEAVERLVLSRKSGKTVELPDGGRIRKHGGRLSFSNIKVEK